MCSNVDNKIRGDNPLNSCKVSNSYDNPLKKTMNSGPYKLADYSSFGIVYHCVVIVE